MKSLPNVLLGIAIVVIIYAVIGKITGMTSIDFGIVKAWPVTCLAIANALMLIGISIKISSK